MTALNIVHARRLTWKQPCILVSKCEFNDLILGAPLPLCGSTVFVVGSDWRGMNLGIEEKRSMYTVGYNNSLTMMMFLTTVWLSASVRQNSSTNASIAITKEVGCQRTGFRGSIAMVDRKDLLPLIPTVWGHTASQLSLFPTAKRVSTWGLDQAYFDGSLNTLGAIIPYVDHSGQINHCVQHIRVFVHFILQLLQQQYCILLGSL